LFFIAAAVPRSSALTSACPQRSNKRRIPFMLFIVGWMLLIVYLFWFMITVLLYEACETTNGGPTQKEHPGN
jgi:hypothetical protein